MSCEAGAAVAFIICVIGVSGAAICAIIGWIKECVEDYKMEKDLKNKRSPHGHRKQ